MVRLKAADAAGETGVASEVSGVPSWNRAPSASSKRQRRMSGLDSHRAARRGATIGELAGTVSVS